MTQAQESQGYFLDPDHPANFAQRTKLDRQIDENAAHREALMPSSRSAGQPVLPAEPTRPVSEVERLFPDQERVARAQEFLSYYGGPGRS